MSKRSRYQQADRSDETGRYVYPPAPKEGEEIADFQKCKTRQEKEDWLTAAALIRNEQFKLQVLKADLKPRYNPKYDFEYMTEEEKKMIRRGVDHEA